MASRPYDARTLRYVASQLAYASQPTIRSGQSAEVKAELAHWGNEYRLEANRIARATKKRESAGKK